MQKPLTLAKKCKEAGLNSRKQLSEITGESCQNLDNWSKKKPMLFKCLLIGAVEIDRREKFKINIKTVK